MKLSKTQQIGSIEYCVYCGNKAKEEVKWDDYEQYTSYYCDCEGGKISQEAMILIGKADAIAIKNINKLDKLKYDEEVRNLKYKYGIDTMKK